MDICTAGRLPTPGRGIEAQEFFKKMKEMATPAGFEPATIRLEGECSIQLSYGANFSGTQTVPR